MNLATLSLKELRTAAEYSARPEYQQAARNEILRRMSCQDDVYDRDKRRPS